MKQRLQIKVLSFILIGVMMAASCHQEINLPPGSNSTVVDKQVDLLVYSSDTLFKGADGYFTISAKGTLDTTHHKILFRYTMPNCMDQRVDTVVKLSIETNTIYYLTTYRITPSGTVIYYNVALQYPLAGCVPVEL